jgi:ABC-2 type transport system ATP-binding protein
MMLGLIRPTAGSVRIFGRDPQVSVAALEGVAGFVEAPSFYPYLSGRRNLELFAALDGPANGSAPRIDAVLDTVGLLDRAKDRVRGYSHGMRQRLGIAAALLRDPRLLILDEPTTGLDPAGMRDMRELVRGLAARGITVLLSSHLLVEVDELCNRVAIVRRGRIAYEGSLEELRRTAGLSYRLRTTDDERARELLTGEPNVRAVEADFRQGLSFKVTGERTVGELSLALAEAGVAVLELSPKQATLEELFFRLTEDGAAPPQGATAPEEAGVAV